MNGRTTVMHTTTGKTRIIGILNVTPDSFSNDGFLAVEDAVRHAKQTVADVDIIDIGAESSRPNSKRVAEQEELKRVLPVIQRLVHEIPTPLSIDTYKPRVAEEALKLGVKMINDITGLRDPEMRKVVARYRVPVIIMHMQGNPKTMQENPVYGDVVADISTFFRERIALAQASGIRDRDIILDPGIGFGKTLEHNLEIFRRLHEFTALGFPILVGPSRKGFIGEITGLPVDQRVEGTLAAVVTAILNGANYVRVHDVKECKRAVQIVDAICMPRSTSRNFPS